MWLRSRLFGFTPYSFDERFHCAAMAGQMSAEQQAIMALQTELHGVRDQLMQVTQSRDALKIAHEALRTEADAQLRARHEEITKTEERKHGFSGS